MYGICYFKKKRAVHFDAISISLYQEGVQHNNRKKTEICEGVSTDVIPSRAGLLHSCQQWAPFLSTFFSPFDCLDTCQQAQFVLHLKKRGDGSRRREN